MGIRIGANGRRAGRPVRVQRHLGFPKEGVVREAIDSFTVVLVPLIFWLRTLLPGVPSRKSFAVLSTDARCQLEWDALYDAG